MNEGAAYMNYKCQLICNIRNQLFLHNVVDGTRCPDLVDTKNSNMVSIGNS
jgi:hypothetical protein